MPHKDGVLFAYNDAVSGQIQVGTINSEWFETNRGFREGFSEVLLKGAFTNSTGTTQIFVDESHDGVNVAYSSTDQFASVAAGVKVPVAARFVKIRIVQATAATTAADLSVKASD